MGYSTNFEWSIVHNVPVEIYRTIEDYIEESDFGYAFHDSYNWYDHEANMKDLSKAFPDVVFELHGEGEDNEDMWYKYFKNGKMQVCEAVISFDSYDERKLR
ncbi:hypothetical protein MKY96_32865 [Paenibacillus sp. FSL R7-0302]|uniref:hypothetical protein n=1 Tax=Paenibacillus sp. FSL R7-0302 TaxID=2921681 RepID=UPI0030FBE859